MNFSDSRNKRTRVAEGEEDGIGISLQSDIKGLRVLLQTPGNESRPDLSTSGQVELLVNPFIAAVAGLRVRVTATDEPKSACIRNCGGQRATGYPAHRRENDRRCNAKHFGNLRFHKFHNQVNELRISCCRIKNLGISSGVR